MRVTVSLTPIVIIEGDRQPKPIVVEDDRQLVSTPFVIVVVTSILGQGHHVEFSVVHTTTVEQLKLSIENNSIPFSYASNHSLLYGGVVLDDNRPLSDYSIGPGSTLVSCHHDEESAPVLDGDGVVADYVKYDLSQIAGNGGNGNDFNPNLPNEKKNTVYIVWLANKKLFCVIENAERNGDGNISLSSLLRQITKIGRACDLQGFHHKLEHLRTWNNFSMLQWVALSYDGNSEDAEKALQLAHISAFRAGEWFCIEMIDRAKIVSLMELFVERRGGSVTYGCTNMNLSCDFNSLPVDHHPGGQVYSVKLGWTPRDAALIAGIQNDNHADNDVREWCRNMMSRKIGCAYQGPHPVRDRLQKGLFWACGYTDFAKYNILLYTDRPFYEEKEEHIRKHQYWIEYGEWFDIDEEKHRGYKEFVLERSMTKTFKYDWDYYRHLISTGFISQGTIETLMMGNYIEM